MVHSRSVEGAWKHANRSWLRGFSRRPSVPQQMTYFTPVYPFSDLPVPPPPPKEWISKPRLKRHCDEYFAEDVHFLGAVEDRPLLFVSG